MRVDKPEVHEGCLILVESVKLADFFIYLDTITVAHELVVDPEKFFKIMRNATDQKAFSSSCKLECEAK